ncbi:hypothetical protein LGQ02_09380 [Bacillus shivajii]|uniref:hypothetical protein n=1 Tax=Bacillus shivajii TaxID=1983719 RepID=UPI001CF975BE|nr:hypothetical protein [Bacillus shivajii]UCZ54933.1 hypothetical protein LGQ02_09380 [Bacillus shivajii]
MSSPFLSGLLIVVGLYVLSELLLWRFPSKSYLKYVPSLIGIVTSGIIAVVSTLNFVSLHVYIDYVFFSIVIFSLSGLTGVSMTMRHEPLLSKLLQEKIEEKYQ